MNDQDLQKMISNLARYLRHNPEGLGVEIDDLGWASLEEVYEGYVMSHPEEIGEDDFHQAISQYNRNRFEVEDGRIRAKKGHTASKVSYEMGEPPEGLYRTYPMRYYDLLENEGINAGKKKYLEFFSNPLQAFTDAKRRRIKKGILVSIKTQEAYHDGTIFYKNGQSWYVSEVDSVHLEIEEPEES